VFGVGIPSHQLSMCLHSQLVIGGGVSL